MLSEETRQAYLQRMVPTARWAARRHARPHPYLGEDDLFQEAMIALLRVWERYYGAPEDDLGRMGRAAVLRQVWGTCAKANSRGEGQVAAWVDLDGRVGDSEESRPLADVIGAEVGDESCFFPFEMDELEGCLSDQARAVFQETAAPGKRTLRAVRRAWRSREGKRGNWWAKYATEILARGTGLPMAKARQAQKEVRLAVKEIFSPGEMPMVRYREVGGDDSHGVQLKRRGEMLMGPEKTFLPDDKEIGLPEPEKPAVKQAAAKKAAGNIKAGPKKAAKPKAVLAEKSAVGLMGFITGEFRRRAATVADVVEIAMKAYPGKKEKTVTATARFILSDGHGYLAKKGLRAKRDADKGTYKIAAK